VQSASSSLLFQYRDAVRSSLIRLWQLHRRLTRGGVKARLERLERLAHGGHATYVGNNRVLAKTVIADQVLSFLLEADDRLIVPRVITHGDHEPEVTRYLVSTVRRTDHCLDVGANFGYFTCLMAKLAEQGRVIAVEPDPAVYALVRDNIYINSFQAVAAALNAAAADGPGRLTLYRRMTRSGNTSIIPIPADSEWIRSLGEAPAAPFEVDCLSVDDLLPRFDGRLDVIKIDVEGAEPLVFRGMSETLAANPKLKIVMEWSPGQMRDAGFDVGDFLNELDRLGLQAGVINSRGRIERLPRVEALRDHAYHSGVLLTPRA